MRLGCGSFVNAMEAAFGIEITTPGILDYLDYRLCLQELFLEKEENTREALLKGTCDDRYFRCFEEFFLTNILVLTIRNGRYVGYEAPGRTPYLRSLHFDTCAVVFANEVLLYGSKNVSYEVMIEDEESIFSTSDVQPAMFEITSSVHPEIYPEPLRAPPLAAARILRSGTDSPLDSQFINSDGKCYQVLSHEPRISLAAFPCYCAPLALPIRREEPKPTFPDFIEDPLGRFEPIPVPAKAFSDSTRVYFSL